MPWHVRAHYITLECGSGHATACPYKFYETIECFSGGDELGMTWIGIILEVDEVGGDEIAEGFAVTDVVSDDMTQELSAEGL